MSPENQRALLIDAEPETKRLLELGPLIKNTALSRTAKLTIMLKIADDVGKAIGRHASCSKGCSACCNQAVPLADLEAKLIGEAIGRPRKPVARFIGRMPTHLLVKVQQEEAKRWWGVPCTFLGDDGTCTIYEHRPLACRTHNSLSDPEKCDTAKPHVLHASYNINAFPMACAQILRGTPYADIREFFPERHAEVLAVEDEAEQRRAIQDFNPERK